MRAALRDRARVGGARRLRGRSPALRGAAGARGALEAARAGRTDEALALLDEVIALDPSRFWYPVAVKFQLLLAKGDPEAAYAYGREIVAGAARDNPHGLHDVGSAILADTRRRDLALAEAALGRAHALTHGENPDVLRSLARLRAMQGRRDEAGALLGRALRFAAPADHAAIAGERAALD